LLTAAGLDESFGFHWLRHSYGTALAAEGVPMRTPHPGLDVAEPRPVGRATAWPLRRTPEADASCGGGSV